MHESNSENQLGRLVITNRSSGTTLVFGAAAAVVTAGMGDTISGFVSTILSEASHMWDTTSWDTSPMLSVSHFHISYTSKDGLEISIDGSGSTSGISASHTANPPKPNP